MVEEPHVALSIECDLEAERITERLGVGPSAVRRYVNAAEKRELTSWRLDLGHGPIMYEAVRRATERLIELGDDVADRVAALLTETNGQATLMIVQLVSEDWRSKGIAIPSAGVRWLARAGASVTIDQYLSDGQMNSGS
jgi:hypothetical protein